MSRFGLGARRGGRSKAKPRGGASQSPRGSVGASNGRPALGLARAPHSPGRFAGTSPRSGTSSNNRFHNKHYYDPNFISFEDQQKIITYLQTLRPLWEMRYSKHHSPPVGQTNRRLLRPVYWLGSWQFACLNYYHPPKGTLHRCVRAEPFPEVLQKLVEQIERLVHFNYSPRDIPEGWRLNVCLINFYGHTLDTTTGKWIDTARVGEHKDFEPGPVASLSLGERAMFQFVQSSGSEAPSRVILQQWLDNGSLQIFGGDRWKSQVFHRVQRVDRNKSGLDFNFDIDGFKTRRVNFTFRFVPDEHVFDVHELPPTDQQDISEYIAELAQVSKYFAGLVE